MTSFMSDEKKQKMKNELENFSNNPMKRSNSVSVFRSKTKSMDQLEDSSDINDYNRKSLIRFANSMEKTNDKLANFSPQNIVGKTNKKKNKKKKLTFRKKFVDAIRIESYKKYNVELCYSEPVYLGESTKCRCQIF